ncbi:MAG: nuclear transport factor 2 family protein [Alphaproteobacteria bacterium]|nr:nuclear transport factor 2 family protein [Alphaproteobacteria bacterium]
MSQEAAVLFANEAFYLAFSMRDIKTMDELWSTHKYVSCVHPGWQPLTDRETVMESWVGIFGNPGAPRVELREPHVVFHGDVAVVTCYEVLDEGVLAATNLFRHEADSWKMIHHHASPVAEKPIFETPEPRAPRLQ